ADTLLGGLGDDTIDGGVGNDVIYSNGGDDILTGGTGADSFRFTEGGSSSDTITDFEDGVDKIFIGAATGATTFAQLFITSGGAGVYVVTADGQSIFIDNINPGQIDHTDFIFGG
ncbi:MAG TPA: hypothetical protein VEA15_00005, partial [Caulobacteraceae bacterium]|nr:hypothetical protein [Caulobacteraceae bacterium]